MSTEQPATKILEASFDRDLENARVLLEDSPWKENPKKYRKVAEGILRRILTFDPANQAAKLLLAKATAPLAEIEPENPRLPPPAVESVVQPLKLEIAVSAPTAAPI